jgi:glycosyltransferase involved in cell wall biosynthesis
MISIIIPIYNSEQYIYDCISSIISQSFKDLEVILIDDGSMDKSFDLCQELVKKDNRIKLFHKSNGGVSSARNVGLDSARGKWLTFIDSDDNVSLNFLSDLSNHEEDILFTEYIAKNSTSKILASINHSELLESSSISDFINSFFSDTILRSPWARFYKKELLGELRFVGEMKIDEGILNNKVLFFIVSFAVK